MYHVVPEPTEASFASVMQWRKRRHPRTDSLGAKMRNNVNLGSFFRSLGRRGCVGIRIVCTQSLAERNMKRGEKVDKIKGVNTRTVTLAFGNGNNPNVVSQLEVPVINLDHTRGKINEDVE